MTQEHDSQTAIHNLTTTCVFFTYDLYGPIHLHMDLFLDLYMDLYMDLYIWTYIWTRDLR